MLIVRPAAGTTVSGPVLPSDARGAEVIRVDLAKLQGGDPTQNVPVRDGDTMYVPRGEKVFIYGHVHAPGAYAMQKEMTVLQALALAGGVTERGASNRLRIVRVVDGARQEIKVKAGDRVEPGDTIIVPESTLMQPDERLRSMTARAGPVGIEGATVGDFAHPVHRTSHRGLPARPAQAAVDGYSGPDHILLVVAYSTFTAMPIYEARAQLLIEAEAQNIISFKEVVEQDRATTDYYQTQYRILQSRGLAKATLDALQLWNHPEFGGSPTDSKAARPPGTLDRIWRPVHAARAWLSARITGGPESVAPPTPSQGQPSSLEVQLKTDETGVQSRAIHAFLGRLTIAPVRNSRLVDVNFRSTYPNLAATVANTLAQQYIQQNLQFKFQASKQATEWLTNQLAAQRKLVQESEIALQKYREQHDTISTENSSNIVVQKLTNLNTAVTTAKTDRIQKEALYRQLQAAKMILLHSTRFQPFSRVPTFSG